MRQYATFLRGINVGGRIIKMNQLKDCFEALGLEEVKTLLQSGNVVFTTDRPDSSLKALIEAALSSTFNYPAKVQVYSLAELINIIDNYPFGAPELKSHDYVIFMENGLEKNITKEEYDLASDEQVQTGRGVVYWRVDKGSTLKTAFARLLTKSKYKEVNTNRNLNTLKKLVRL